jgi:malate synthase
LSGAPAPASRAGFRLNSPPPEVDLAAELPRGFREFYAPLHRRFTPWQQQLILKRRQALAASHAGSLPQHFSSAEAKADTWRIELPDWCADQRNQMTGPADDAELCVKMLNSGAPGVMLDLEDSCVNEWTHQQLGLENVRACLHGELSYFDKKRNQQVGIRDGRVVILIRPRGLHISQAGVVGDDLTAASLWDAASVVYRVERDALRHPLTFYIPKSESAEEAQWWREALRALAEARGWPADAIKCMALVESHPLAYQMEQFLFELRDHILALNLGRWDYMASLIHFNFEDPAWVLPDRNTIPHDVPFFQRLRELMVETCHKRGALAIGGMTALYPSREDAELNARALAVLEKDKHNEAEVGMDGAWTGHPDQNAIAVAQFPAPNQLARRINVDPQIDLRPAPQGVGARTIAGTRAAVRTVIRYRNGVLNGRGASLLDGYMEDLATDRIYRLMLAQRLRHRERVQVSGKDGEPVVHTPELLHRLFDEELARLEADPPKDVGDVALLRQARAAAEAMVMNGEFDPF